MKVWRRNRKASFDIFLPQHIYHKMLAYAKVCDGEISGWGKTKVTKKKDETITHVTVVDIRIFKQVVSGAHTALDGNMLTKFYVELAKEGENMGDWNLWWHSHNDFGVFFSGTDDDTATSNAAGRLYSICINKKGDLIARVDENHKQIADGIYPRVENPVQDSLMAACRTEVKKKVTVERYRIKKGAYVIHSGMYTPPFTPTFDRRFPVNGEPHSMVPDSAFEDDRFDHLDRTHKRVEYYNKLVRRINDGD